jgi:hypothetical protein
MIAGLLAALAAAPVASSEPPTRPAEPARVKKQIAGAVISPDWVDDPSRALPYIQEAAEAGYRTFNFSVRNQKRSLLDPAVRDAVGELVSLCHRHALRAMLDTDPTWWGDVIAEQRPEAALQLTESVEATCRDGAYSFVAPMSPAGSGKGLATVLFAGIPAVFQADGNDFRRVPTADLAWQWMNGNKGVIVTGNVKGGYEGKLIFYVDFKTFGLADLAHPTYLKAQRQLLDLYRGIPLDAIGWDEPGKGPTTLTTFKTGEGFSKFFQQQNGYALEDRLVWLDHGDGRPEAVKLRCDYYRTLSEMNYRAQKEHNDYALELFGKNLMLGTHQTWSGLGPDLTAGVMDYFKLGKVSTAAWTDGSWNNQPFKFVVYNFMLAESLKKELRRRDAYYNDWGRWVPVVEDMRFATRFQMLFHINWWNIFYSDSTELILNYRQEPLRTLAQQDVANLDAFDAFVGDRFFPHTDVAIFYGWESMAALSKSLVGPLYATFANLSLCLADSGLFGAQVSSEGILHAVPDKRTFTVSGHRYRVLVVPFGVVMSGPVYGKIMQMCAAGVPVVFYGPPPAYLAETGKDITAEFAKAAGFKPFAFAEYETLRKFGGPWPKRRRSMSFRSHSESRGSTVRAQSHGL